MTSADDLLAEPNPRRIRSIALDPTSRFNPGIGLTPVGHGWSEHDNLGDAE